MRSTWDRVRIVVANFRAQHGPMTAAAVSFWAVLSLVPTVLLGVSLFGYFVGSSDEAFQRVMGCAESVLSGDTEGLRGALEQVVDRRGSVGGVGLLVLAYSGTQWIVTLEAALNAQWDAPPRGVIASRLLALLLFLLLGVFLLFSTVATGAIAAAGQWRIPWLKLQLERIPVLGQLPVQILPFLISMATFGLLYRVLPNTVVPVRSAAEAGALAGVAWEGAKLLYALYLSRFARLDMLYGPLGAVIGLFIWIYFSSVLVLLGSEWARSRGRGDAATRRRGDARTRAGRRVQKRETRRRQRGTKRG